MQVGPTHSSCVMGAATDGMHACCCCCCFDSCGVPVAHLPSTGRARMAPLTRSNFLATSNLSFRPPRFAAASGAPADRGALQHPPPGEAVRHHPGQRGGAAGGARGRGGDQRGGRGGGSRDAGAQRHCGGLGGRGGEPHAAPGPELVRTKRHCNGFYEHPVSETAQCAL